MRAQPLHIAHPSPDDELAIEGLTRWQFSRRGLLLTAGAIVLAACGSDGSDGDDGQGDGGAGAATVPPVEIPPEGFRLVQRFPNTVLVPGTVRLPISLAAEATILAEGIPAELRASVSDVDGAVVVTGLTGVRRDAVPFPYYAFRVELAAPGVYFLDVEGGTAEGAAFQLFAPADVAVPLVGEALPPFDTPTVDDARGVEPYCTRVPQPCPFHDVTLTEALAAGTPVAYLVGTPAHCQTGTCAPALESMIELADRYAGRLTFVHAEIYRDDAATTLAPAVEAIELDYEPVLFVTDASGTIVDRLDAVWNTSELDEVLAAATGA
jgi:hypothetical protein